MPAVSVIGAQWGDEGKGKVVDVLGESADYSVRYQGGNNAGHTLVIDGEKYTFHALPSGVMRGLRNLIGSEVVLDPRQLEKEIEKFGGEVDLGIDPRTAIIMPWHNDIDIAREAQRAKETGAAIGTTAKGIGPCYEDDANRSGIRFFELVGNQVHLEKRVKDVYNTKKALIEKVYGQKMNYSAEDVLDEYMALGYYLRDYFADVSLEVSNALNDKKKVIFEGAQGTLLDKKFGNYPKVTSSHPMSGAIFDSVGIPPMKIRTIGIVKAYVTKVGSGPVVTCLDGGRWPVDEAYSEDVAKKIRDIGGEVGTTTGRPRRVGWLDLVALKYTTRINGFSEIALTKLDCMSDIGDLKVATAYKCCDKETTDYKGWDLEHLNRCEPVYETFEGFGDITKAKTFRQLPKPAREYIQAIESYIGVPVTVIGTGPDREETIFRKFKKF